MKSLLGGVLLCLLAFCDLAAKEQVLQAEGKTRWCRGNLHTHSHWSDGDDYLEAIALWYRKHDYDFLVFTDHNVLADSEHWVRVEETKGGQQAFEHLQQVFPDWVEHRVVEGKLEVRLRRFDEVSEKLNQSGQFLLVQGEEVSDAFEKIPIHLNVSNIQHLINPRHGRDVFDTIQNNVRAALKQREETGQPMLVHLNHPNYGYAVTAEDLMRLQGEKYFEVYNGHPYVNNHGDSQHAGTEKMWDIVLAYRIAALDLPPMFGLAVDDSHAYQTQSPKQSNPGRGWVMVLASELTPRALIESLERGDFYATSGVALKTIAHDSSGLRIEVDPKLGETYKIEFVGTRRDANLVGEPVLDEEGKPMRATRRYGAQIGEVLKEVEGTTGSYEFSGDELYVRARVTSSAKHPNPSEPGDFKQAWVQPVLGPGAPDTSGVGLP